VRIPLSAALAIALAICGCASLGPLARFVQPPVFMQDPDRPAEIRVLTPSFSEPLGAANVRLWMSVENPNPFGFTLHTLQTTLFLENTRAAVGEFPLGLPLGARQQSVVPIDLTVSFADLPNLANAVRRAATGRSLGYRLDGTIGVDAGRLGQPTFGPMLLMQGDVAITR
jgi:late embryogenesis abundant protein